MIFTYFFFSVSKTTKELILKWKEDKPVDISHEVKMPQFEIFKVNPAKCEETFHIGMCFMYYLNSEVIEYVFIFFLDELKNN